MKQIKVNNTIVPSLVIFIINPVLGILTQVLNFYKSNTNYAGRTVYLLISVYLGLINTTVEIDSIADLPSYYELYKGSTDILSLIKNSPYEILYVAFTYLMYYLTLGNFKVFILLFTVIVYQLVFVSLDTIIRKMDDTNKLLPLYAVLIFAFYHPHFLQSLNLMRQILAGSIFFYFFAKRFTQDKTLWYLPIVAILIHRSSLILFVFSFIPALSKRLNVKSILIITFSVGILILSSSYLISFLLFVLSPFPMLQASFSSLQDLESTNYTWYDGGGSGGLRLVYFGLLGMLIVSYKKLTEKMLTYILYFAMLFVVLLEFYYSSNLLLLHFRMAIYLNYFIPIALVLLISQFKSSILKNFLSLSLILVIVYRFFNALATYGIKYDSTTELLVNSIFFYF